MARVSLWKLLKKHYRELYILEENLSDFSEELKNSQEQAMKLNSYCINFLSILPKTFLEKPRRKKKMSTCLKSRKYDNILNEEHLHDSSDSDLRTRLNFLERLSN